MFGVHGARSTVTPNRRPASLRRSRSREGLGAHLPCMPACASAHLRVGHRCGHIARPPPRRWVVRAGSGMNCRRRSD